MMTHVVPMNCKDALGKQQTNKNKVQMNLELFHLKAYIRILCMPLSVAVEDSYLNLPKMLLVLNIIKGNEIPKCSRTPLTRTLKGNE